MICDDHAIWRKGLASVLKAEGDIDILEAKNGEEAIDQAKRNKPDVILLDLYMPYLDGLHAIGKIRQVSPLTKIIMLTVSQRNDHILRAANQGVRGYISKDASPDEIVNAVRRAMGGESVFSQSATEKIVPERVRSTAINLSTREQEIISLIADGRSNQEISSKLAITPNTVRTHIYRIKNKLQLDSRAAITAYALRRQLPGDPTL